MGEDTPLDPSDFNAVKQYTLGWMEKEGLEDSIDEGLREVVRVLNSHPDICTLESCAGRIDLYVSPEDVFETGREPLPENPETGLPRFHDCCPLCSQGSICDLQKLVVHKVKSDLYELGDSHITYPMQPELRLDWMPEYREEWSHGLKKFGSPLTVGDIEGVLGDLDVPDGYMILLDLKLPYLMVVFRDSETGGDFLNFVHSAGWVYSFWVSYPRDYGPADDSFPFSNMRFVMVMNMMRFGVYIPLSNSKESLPPPERLELIVREANAAMERWQAKLPALEQVPSSL